MYYYDTSTLQIIFLHAWAELNKRHRNRPAVPTRRFIVAGLGQRLRFMSEVRLIGSSNLFHGCSFGPHCLLPSIAPLPSLKSDKNWRVYCLGLLLRGWGIRWQAGQSIMKRVLLTRGVYEPDLDMARVIARLSGGRVRRLLGSIFRNLQGPYKIDTPRRSVDREQQQYSPDYD